MTGNGHSWQRTISEKREAELVLAEGAGDGPNAPWARFGRTAPTPGATARTSCATNASRRSAPTGRRGTKPRSRHWRRCRKRVRRHTDGGTWPATPRSICWPSSSDWRAGWEKAYPESATPLAEPAILPVRRRRQALHPGTQQRVVEMLHQTFPATQFIGTTQSPVVLTTLHPRQITRLTRQGCEEPAAGVDR